VKEESEVYAQEAFLVLVLIDMQPLSPRRYTEDGYAECERWSHRKEAEYKRLCDAQAGIDDFEGTDFGTGVFIVCFRPQACHSDTCACSFSPPALSLRLSLSA
jgi:hypothetical protein